MFPHDSIPNDFYEHIVRKLDDKAVQDPAVVGVSSQ